MKNQGVAAVGQTSVVEGRYSPPLSDTAVGATLTVYTRVHYTRKTDYPPWNSPV